MPLITHKPPQLHRTSRPAIHTHTHTGRENSISKSRCHFICSVEIENDSRHSYGIIGRWGFLTYNCCCCGCCWWWCELEINLFHSFFSTVNPFHLLAPGPYLERSKQTSLLKWNKNKNDNFPISTVYPIADGERERERQWKPWATHSTISNAIVVV